MLLMIDNYDSFTYNLVQYLQELGEEVVVHRNDEISVSEITDLRPARIVLKGDIPSPIAPPSGCVFRTRCPHAIARCAQTVPRSESIGPDHSVACLRHRELQI